VRGLRFEVLQHGLADVFGLIPISREILEYERRGGGTTSKVTDDHLFIGNNLGDARSCLRGATGFSKALRIGCPGGADALPGTSNRFVKREPSFNADYRGGVTCLYDTQLLGACLHASECGGRSRPQAVRSMPDVPIAPPATGPPEGWAAVGFVTPASFNRGFK